MVLVVDTKQVPAPRTSSNFASLPRSSHKSTVPCWITRTCTIGRVLFQEVRNTMADGGCFHANSFRSTALCRIPLRL
jgi:hypothetical protein